MKWDDMEIRMINNYKNCITDYIVYNISLKKIIYFHFLKRDYFSKLDILITGLQRRNK